jgi:large subunit ribosomal protein L21
MAKATNKYAVIETGGQQYAVREGEVHKIGKLEGEAGSKVQFDTVLLVNDGGKVKVGKPTVKNAKVTAELIEQTRDKKITVFKFKRRKKYRKKTGHRQDVTYVRITDIA